MVRKLAAVAFATASLTAVGSAPASAAITGPPQTVASGLSYPWEVLPMPDGRLLVTERPGRIRVISASGTLLAQSAYTSLGGDFLGLAISPNYAVNRFVYLYDKYPDSSGGFTNRIQRFSDDGTTLTLSATIFDGIPGDPHEIHDGGRMKFGPDGKLYVTTGDAHIPSAPQDLESLAGKILRLNAPGDETDGTAPEDNPFPDGANSKFVWSYGHRHPEGLDWDAAGQLWETEHGPSGEAYAAGRCCRDELNEIDKGANYGWPVIMGSEQQDGMRSPAAHSGDTTVWAPGGAAFGPDGELYVPALAGQHLREFSLSGGQVTRQRELLRLELGRLRTAVYANGFLYLTTSGNTTDEKVLKVPIDAQPPATSVVWAVGDAAANADSQATANRITGRIDRVLYLGDVYDNGTAADFTTNFDPVWGRFMALASPTPGNHDWLNRATGYDPYWGARAPQTSGGEYYAFTENGWTVLSLDSEEPMAPGSPQYQWLAQQLTGPGNCRIAFFHRPRYAAPGGASDAPDVQPLWDLMANKVRFVINGHIHAMMRANPVNGITELVDGAGGQSHQAAGADARFAFVNTTDFGVLRLKLGAVGSNPDGGATVQHDFIATDDGAVLDSGSGTCSPVPPPANPYRTAVLADGPVGYWRMGEATGKTAADAVTPAHNGTYTGKFTLGRPGATAGDTAVLLDGKTGAVTVPSSGTLNTADTFSLETWVTTTVTGKTQSLLVKGASYQLYLDSANRPVLRKPNVGVIATATRAVPRDGRFHQVVATKAGNAVVLYVDGVAATGPVTKRALTATTTALSIGAGAGNLTGTMDEVAVYNRALIRAQVSAHFTAAG